MYATRFPSRRPTSPVTAAPCAAGFSLVELMVVIAVMAIAAAVVLPLVESSRGVGLPMAAQVMQRDLEWAQVEAQRRSEDVLVIVYPWNEQYGMWDITPSFAVLPHPYLQSDELTASGLVDLPVATGNDELDIVSADLDSGRYYFVYNAQGEPVRYLDSADTPIAGDRKIVLGLGDRRYSVIVRPIVGMVITRPGS